MAISPKKIVIRVKKENLLNKVYLTINCHIAMYVAIEELVSNRYVHITQYREGIA